MDAQAAILRRRFRRISALLSANTFWVLRARSRRDGQIQRSERIQDTITHEGQRQTKAGALPLFRQFAPPRACSKGSMLAECWSEAGEAIFNFRGNWVK